LKPGSVLLAVLLINGFGEEVGWRGFLLHRLVREYSPFISTLVIGFCWLLWHLPLFWLNEGMAALAGPAMLGWGVGLICGAFVLSFVYIAGGSNILAVAVWHTTFDLVAATPAGTGAPAAIISTVVMLWGILVAFRWWRRTLGPISFF
jgi:membrane protease YdiL (CAAX protease family)